MIYLIKTSYYDEKTCKPALLLKIGYAENVEDRIKTYKTHNPLIQLLATREGGFDLETYLHKYFKEFAYSNQPEWFYYNEKIIKEFKYVEDKPFIEDVTSKVKSVFFTAPSFSKFRKKYIEKYGKDEFNKCDNFIFNYWLDYSRRMKGIELEVNGDIKQISWDSKIYVSNLPFNTPDIEIEISALFGRQRNKNNQFKNNVTIFYKLLKNENLEDKSQFDKLQFNRKEKTYRLINIYNKVEGIEKSDYSGKIRSSIEVENYCEDFASVSRKTGEVVYNNLIEVANERAWEVAQKDYQDSINVTRAISSLGYEMDNSRDKNDIAVDMFLTGFDQIGDFEGKMKLYCEFRDKNVGNIELEYKLHYKITSNYGDDNKFENYYNFYGTDGCRAKSYIESDLRKGISNNTKEDKLEKEIFNQFKLGDVLPKQSIKDKLRQIYLSLEIGSTPKATDLEQWFELKSTTIKNQNSKWVNGFEIIRRK